jgi:hypothetical protein
LKPSAATTPQPEEDQREHADLVDPAVPQQRMALVDLLRAPSLPPTLQPSDWHLPALRAAIGQVQHAYFPPVAAYVRGLLDG